MRADVPGIRGRTLSAAEFLDADVPEPDAIVHQLIPGGTTTILAGQHKVGKTILMLQLAMACASGRPWLWWDTSQVRVLYLNYEVAEWSFQQRVDRTMRGFAGTFGKHTQADIRNNLWVNSLPNLRINRPPDLKTVREWIEQIQAGLVIFDPIRAAYTGDRNDDREVDRVMTLLLEEVVQPTGAALLLGHHLRKPPPGEQGGGSTWEVKGSGGWADAADQIITLRHNRKDSSGKGRFLNATVRHYESREDVPLHLKPAAMLFTTESGSTEAGPTETDRLRDAFRRSMHGTLTIDDIAAVLGISNDAAWKRWQRHSLPRLRRVDSGPGRKAVFAWEA